MSRGFVKEDDQEEAPFIPPRAPLPVGVPNYVTQTGLAELKQEQQALEEERKSLKAENDVERRKSLAELNGKLSLLDERLASAKLILAKEQVQDEVRFGATVSFTVIDGQPKGLERCFTIVGVDEANIKHKKVAFTAPIIKVLIGKKANETVWFTMGELKQLLEINSIHYK